MTPDNISTAKASDLSSLNDFSASVIQLKSEEVRNLSGNNISSESTEPPPAAEGDLGSSVRWRGKKSFVSQPFLKPVSLIENVGDTKRKKILRLSNRISDIRNAALRRTGEERFHLLQKFQGQVTEILQQEFKARLFDLSRDESAYEFAIFSVDEIDTSDAELLREGAIFYWYIGYSSGPRGRRRLSFIHFSRSGRMTKAQYEAAYDELGDMWRILSAELPPTA